MTPPPTHTPRTPLTESPPQKVNVDKTPTCEIPKTVTADILMQTHGLSPSPQIRLDSNRIRRAQLKAREQWGELKPRAQAALGSLAFAVTFPYLTLVRHRSLATEYRWGSFLCSLRSWCAGTVMLSHEVEARVGQSGRPRERVERITVEAVLVGLASQSAIQTGQSPPLTESAWVIIRTGPQQANPQSISLLGYAHLLPQNSYRFQLPTLHLPSVLFQLWPPSSNCTVPPGAMHSTSSRRLWNSTT